MSSSRHRTGSIDHEDNIFRGVFLFGPVRLRRNHQKEIAVFARLAMSQQRETEIFFGDCVEQLEVLLFFAAFTFKRNDGLTVAVVLNVNDVRW